MRCMVCDRGMAEMVNLFRVNAKGIPGEYVCTDHLTDSVAVDPEVRELAELISESQ